VYDFVGVHTISWKTNTLLLWGHLQGLCVICPVRTPHLREVKVRESSKLTLRLTM